MGKTGFLDDLFENGDPDFDAPVNPITAETRSAELVSSEPMFIEKCPSCKGTGQFGRGKPCFKCKGRGSRKFKTSPEKRAQGVENRYRKRIKDVRTAWKLDVLADSYTDERADAVIAALDALVDQHERRGKNPLAGITESDEWIILQIYKRRDELSMLEIAFTGIMLRKYKRQFGHYLAIQIYGEK